MDGRQDVLSLDVQSLRSLLESGTLKSTDLVDLYLSQIQRHDNYLHAMLSMPPAERLREVAEALDKERGDGKLRSKLHGIPVILKDNINTHPSLGMKSSAGSLALENARPRENAPVADKVIAAGMIILGKANLSELSNFRGKDMPSGWSALGGQCQSAYVRGGLRADDGKIGHSNPGGSSTGSAVAVSAGYAPLSVGTETDGSLVLPGSRAALYTIKPTIGIISQRGIIPVSHTFDSAGPFGKTPYDIAALLDILREDDAPAYPPGGYTKLLPASLSEFSVAAVDFTKYFYSDEYMPPGEGTKEQMAKEIQAAYQIIEAKARKFSPNVDLVQAEEAYKIDGKNSENMVCVHDFYLDFQAYLDSLEFSPLKNMEELIQFNLDHADLELPEHHPNQKWLELAVEQKLSQDEYQMYFKHMRKVARDQAIDHILDKHDADVIIGPADSCICALASGSGYPIAAMPLGYLDFNGRPFGMVALAREYQETTLIKFMGAWHDTFHPVKPPPMLIGKSAALAGA